MKAGVFASHAPFYYPEGNSYKLVYSELAQADVDTVAFGNAVDIFGP